MKSLRFTLPAAVLLAIGLAVFAAPREPLRGPAWDYKVVPIGDDVKQTESTLRELGADGWECVTHSFAISSGTSHAEALVLKRPK